MNSVLAITRGTQHSQKHVSNDGKMFAMVCDRLRDHGYELEVIDEDDLASVLESSKPERIISMAQRPENTALLAKLESDGVPIVNSFSSVLNTYRVFMALRLAEEPAFAKTRILSSLIEEDLEDFEKNAWEMIRKTLGKPFWLKRGDMHATDPGDVLLIHSAEEFADALGNFRSRSVETAIVQEHVDGEVIKFYGVADGRFFHAQHFTTEKPFEGDQREMQQQADAMAEQLGLTIYGGDLVIGNDGALLFIDMNAWPSFGTVREEGVPKMVEAIIDRFDRVGMNVGTVS